MKRFLKYAALIATVLMVCSSGWAFDATDHIAQAPNNKGDAMIFPWFFVEDGGFQNKLTIINTDQVNSVVAKLVFRSYKNSEELLDFLIYLSPADVWTATVYSVNGVAGVYSDDDSIVIDSAGTFATKDKPFNFAMFPVKCPTDATNYGYIELIAAAIGPVLNPSKVPAPGVLKKDIFAAYNPGIIKPLSTVFDFSVASITNNANVLAGFIEWGNSLVGLTTSYSATTFINYKNTKRLPPNLETIFGEDCNNTLAEIEAAISKNNIAMPYVSGDDDALHFLTFPTKHTGPSDDKCKFTSVESPFFNDNSTADYCLTYSTTNFDLTEKYNSTPVSGDDKTSKFCNEVEVLFPDEFAEGWSNYVFTGPKQVPLLTTDLTLSTAEITYTGAPVLVTYLYLGEKGLSGGYGAWTDTSVEVAGVPVSFYQYSNLGIQ